MSTGIFVTNTDDDTPTDNLLHILKPFFEQYNTKECSNEIWNLMTAYCGQNEASFPDSISRGNTAYFCASLHALLMDLYAIMHDQLHNTSCK